MNFGSNEDISRNFWIRIEINPDPKHCQRFLHLDVNPMNRKEGSDPERLCTPKVPVLVPVVMIEKWPGSHLWKVSRYRTVPYSLLFFTGVGTYFKRHSLFFLKYQAYGVLFFIFTGRVPGTFLFRGPSRAPLVQVLLPRISRCSRQN